MVLPSSLLHDLERLTPGLEPAPPGTLMGAHGLSGFSPSDGSLVLSVPGPGLPGAIFPPLSPAPPVETGPGITVFKPLKGLAPRSRECLASFLTQDYHPYQVLFGVRDPDDPVLELLRELSRAHPRCDHSVVICPEDLGLNPKISTLRQLMPRARYDLLVIADGDVLVGDDYLAQVAAAFRQPGVGLVSCPYRAGPGRTLGSWLEALTIAADFIPSVAVANYVEGIRFALGATMAMTRQALAPSAAWRPWPTSWRMIISWVSGWPRPGSRSKFFPTWWRPTTRR